MRVEQAIYGTVKHGFALRYASGDTQLAGELAQRLDLPDTEPQGVDWSPVTSGFPVNNRYILARTFSDPSVDRSGMVMTHALICHLDEIAAIDDLRPLLAHLITSFDLAPDAVEALDVTPVPGMPPATSDLTDIARALVSRGPGPVVRIGSDGFEAQIVSLWGRLWNGLRRKLYFRLSFGPRDVMETPEPTIVCTPTSLLGRWQKQRIVGRSGATLARAAALIDGSAGAIELREFSTRIGASLNSFHELQLLEQAHAMAFADPDNFAGLVSAVRLIERLSPDLNCGTVEKRTIIERLVEALPAAQPSNILTLRNLTLSSFATSGLAWQALERSVERSEYLPADDADMVTIVSDALVRDDAIQPWREAVMRGLVRSGVTASDQFARAFWRWAESSPLVSSPLIKLIASNRKVLEALEVAGPAHMHAASAKPIIASAKNYGLFKLHAIAVGASMSPAEAALAQSAVEPGTDATAMRLAMRHAKPAEILDTVASVLDGRVLTIAGQAVATDPKLLAKREMSTDPNRCIWVMALRADPGTWQGPEDPRKAFNQLLDEQIDGLQPPTELLDLLSVSPLADITSYPRRSEIWGKLPTAIRDRLLAATTNAWFASVGVGRQSTSIESEMVDRIANDPRLDQLLMHFPAGMLGESLGIIDTLGGLDHTHFRRWALNAVRAVHPLSQTDADLLGRALASRGRSEIVNDMISIYRNGRRDVAPVLRHCLDLMSFFDRYFLGIAPINSTQKWSALTELAAELFPNGPDQNALWERSGGRDADLSHLGTGKERWRRAIRDIECGRQPRVSRLIQQMQVDFPENPKLRLIAKDPLFRN